MGPDEEAREISQKIRLSEHRDSLELVTRWATRADDLLQSLNEYRPVIVQFSGHDNNTEEILLQDASRAPQAVSKAALKQLFSTCKDNIRVVVLNACYSRPQAEAITEVIDCAIGMKKSISDDAARTFAASFYRAIGFGRSVKEAFEQGKAALMLEGIPEAQTPDLPVRAGVDPAEVILAAHNREVVESEVDSSAATSAAVAQLAELGWTVSLATTTFCSRWQIEHCRR